MKEVRITLRNAGKINPESIEDYIKAGGYEALKKARTIDRKVLIDDIESASKLRGRGGAGFKTGLKWSGAYGVDSDVKYVVCNADEGEPGTFKDRTIIENDPHTLIEGMLICAYCIQAQECFIYVRGEYTHCIELLKKAAADAEAKGFCDGVKVNVVGGAGSYVCGEETTLLTSLEGYRGEPRLKPPFPTVAGYLGKPTVVNNVETFATVPVIVDKGSDWFGSIGAPEYPGTKLFSLSGDVKNKGVVELPTDATLRDLVEGFGGGVRDGHTLKAIQMGGGSCGFVTEKDLDTPLDFESMRAIGASLGSGAVLVLDETHNMAEFVKGTSHFFAHESCGKCSPCREGTARLEEAVEDILTGGDPDKNIAMINTLNEVMSMSCFCPLGQGACNPVLSALKLFPEDFKARKEA
ncbi:MAG: SLBB domain-containing protein [Spirochaetales bacterium]|nr:SLBB domain-containing protein [Spirochaetales bacterium]